MMILSRIGHLMSTQYNRWMCAGCVVALTFCARGFGSPPPSVSEPAEHGDMDQNADGRTSELISLAEQRLQDLDRTLTRAKDMASRRERAREQLANVEYDHATGQASLDQLLDSQRRLSEIEIQTLQVAARLGNLTNAMTMSQAAEWFANSRVTSLKAARDRAWRTWRKTYANFRQNPTVHSVDEAQAREQYFQFRKQIDEAAKQLSAAGDGS